jgi:2,5-diketo-D-gluconate reductase B
MDQLPKLGLGTWQNTDDEACIEAVQTAIHTGYRHIDTAQYYGNEELVGEGIAKADVPREDLFVATKVHAEKFGLAHDEVIKGIEVSLERMDLDYFDLVYVHWPVGNYEAAETMPALDEAIERGLIEHVGISNFSVRQVTEAMNHLESSLFALQVECHPLLQQDELITHSREHGYNFVAYSPLARGNVFDIPEVRTIAEKHSVSEAQVSLAWLLSKDNVHAIPKAASPSHIKDNYEALNLELDDADIEKIDGIEREDRYVEREGAPWLVGK